VIYFVGRNRDIAVSELLAILKITKQSLSRVLSHLMRDDFIVQKRGKDRRRRLLSLTPKGTDLERLLTERQSERIARAYREAGAEAVAGFRTVLRGIINEEDRRRVDDADSETD
jgi:DNA-binding MarR family transcriptional regulator